MQDELKTFWIVVDLSGDIFRYKTKQQAIESINEYYDPTDNCIFEVLNEYEPTTKEVNLKLKKRSELDFE